MVAVLVGRSIEGWIGQSVGGRVFLSGGVGGLCLVRSSNGRVDPGGWTKGTDPNHKTRGVGWNKTTPISPTRYSRDGAREGPKNPGGPDNKEQTRAPQRGKKPGGGQIGQNLAPRGGPRVRVVTVPF